MKVFFKKVTAWSALLALVLQTLVLAAPISTAVAAETYPWSRRAATGDYYYDTFAGLPKNSVFQLVTSERLTDILSSEGNYYIAIGGPNQEASQKLFPLIQQRAAAAGVKKVYVLDPYVDGYQIDITDTSASAPAEAWLGSGASASLGTGGVYGASGTWTARPSDVWRIFKHFVPTAATAPGGVLDGFTGQDSALLKVNISDRTTVDIQDGRTLTGSLSLKASELSSWNSISAAKATAIDALINAGIKTSSLRSDWEYFKRIYNGFVNAQSAAEATDEIKAAGILRESDFPNGEGFVFKSIDIKEAFNLLNSPGEVALFFASAACHNTSAIVRATALAAKANEVPVVYIIDPVIDNHHRFGTGAAIDVSQAGRVNVSGTYLRNSATASAYKFSYLYGELVKYFDPGFITENESKRNNSIAYYPNGTVPASGTTGISVDPFSSATTPTVDGYKVLAAGQVRNAKRLQAPTVLAYNKDAAHPVTGNWLHEDPDPLTSSKWTSSLKTYTEYMLEVNYLEQPSDYANGASTANGYKVANPDGGASLTLSRYAVGNEAKAALNALFTRPFTRLVDPDAVLPFTSAPVPTISGVAKVGNTLTATTGTWSPAPAFKYQWYAGGVAISGATAKTYKVGTAALGKTLTVKVTGTLSGYTTTAKTSKATAKVTGDFSKAPKPKIGGKAKVGKKLTVKVGTWSPKPKFTYQWFANGKKIKGATKASLKLKKAQKGKKITVKVTAKKADYVTKTIVSKATKKVAK